MIDLFSIGLGPTLSIGGLCLEGIGVIVSLWPYVLQSDKEIAYEAEAILNSEWSHDRTQDQWLNTNIGKTKIRLRKSARIGLFCLAFGFFVQAIGNYFWATASVQ